MPVESQYMCVREHAHAHIYTSLLTSAKELGEPGTPTPMKFPCGACRAPWEHTEPNQYALCGLLFLKPYSSKTIIRSWGSGTTTVVSFIFSVLRKPRTLFYFGGYWYSTADISMGETRRNDLFICVSSSNHSVALAGECWANATLADRWPGITIN